MELLDKKQKLYDGKRLFANEKRKNNNRTINKKAKNGKNIWICSGATQVTPRSQTKQWAYF